MPTFGRFETVDELYRTPFGCVYSARVAGENGNGRRNDYVVKTYEPPDFHADESLEPDRNGSNDFLERARLQKRVSDAQSAHWAKIQDCAVGEGKPYYVTDYYPRTAQRLIAGRVILGPGALHEIISSVAQGLRELRESCNQPHGCLKPSNILIGGSGDVSGAKIVLTDPLCNIPSEEADRGGDFYALGALLYQLVMLRPFRNTAWPVEDSPEWLRLGKTAARWRMLCTTLLNPDARQRPDADTLQQSLAALAPSGFSVRKIAALPKAAVRKVPARKLAVATSFLALSAGGGGMLIGLKVSACRARVQQARMQWLDALWNDKPTLARLQQSLGQPVIQQAEWDAIDASKGPMTLADFSLSAVHQSAAADAAVDQIKGRLKADYQKSAAPLQQLEQSFEKKGYAEAANFLAGILAAAPPEEASLSSAIDARIVLANKLRHSQPTLSPIATAQLNALKQSPDQDLQAFAKVLSDAFNTTWMLTPDGQWKERGEIDGLLSQVSNKISDWPASYDEAQLNRDVGIHLKQPTLADVQNWLSNLSAYQNVGPSEQQRQADRELSQRLESTVAGIQEQLNRFATNNARQLKDLQNDHDRLKETLAALASQQFPQKYLNAGFAERLKDLGSQIESLRSKYQPAPPSDLAGWFAQKRGMKFDAPAAKEFWSRWLSGRELATVNSQWQSQTDQWASALQNLETALVVPPELRSDPWKDPAQQYAYEQIDNILHLLGPDSPVLSNATIAAAKKNFDEWCGEVEKLKEDHHTLESPIDDAAVAAHDRLWSSTDDRTFWNNEVTGNGRFARPMTEVLARLDAIRNIGKEDSADALKTLRAAERDETVFAAWSRLGQLNNQAFPGALTAADVRQWTNDLIAVGKAASKFPARQKQVSQEINASATAMWKRAVDGATSPDLLAAAADAQDQLPLAADLSPSEPLAQYNWALYRAEHAAVGPAANGALAVLQKCITNMPLDWARFALTTLPTDNPSQAAVKSGFYLWEADQPKWTESWNTARLADTQRQKHIQSELVAADADVQRFDINAAISRLNNLDSPEARQRLQSLVSDKKNAEAELKQGDQFYYGQKRYPEAATMYLKAAQHGSIEALRNIAGMYREGKGVPLNPKKSIDLFELAASKGDSSSVTELAKDFLGNDQYAIQGDAQKEIRNAAAQGNPACIAAEAKMAILNHDADQASRLIAGVQSQPESHLALAGLMRQLAELYESSHNSNGRQWYQAAAQRNDPVAKKWVADHSAISNKSSGGGDGGGFLDKDGK